MSRFIISAPRSGLNWVLFWVEDGYGLHTSHRVVLTGRELTGRAEFKRSHDPLGLRPVRFWRGKRTTPAWTPIAPDAVAGGKVLLILRDPLEVFVRGAGQSFRHFRSYESCLQFHSRAATDQKRVAYYEDLIRRPEAMAEVLAFLDFPPAGGVCPPDATAIAAGWEDAAKRSRDSYGHRHSSGAKTRANPMDFLFHQKALTARRAAAVWQRLDEVLSRDELDLIARYRSGEGAAK